MADMMKLLQQAQQMQSRLQETQAELERTTVTGTSGGGVVSVEADGKGTVRAIRIDASVVDPSDTAMLEDLVLVAVQDAQRRATELGAREMGKLTGGMNLPFQLPF
jgi:DNA-binding YbaB/EbfC family protein